MFARHSHRAPFYIHLLINLIACSKNAFLSAVSVWGSKEMKKPSPPNLRQENTMQNANSQVFLNPTKN